MERTIREHSKPECLALVGALFLLPASFLIPLNHDTYWMLWLARQMVHGVKLYSELIEVNPPLWFWLGAGLQWVAGATELSSLTVFRAFFATVIALSLFLAAVAIQPWPATRRVRFYIAFFIVAFALPLSAFSQREHFVLLAVIPYVLLADRSRSPLWLAIASGLFAGLGISLKPFFVFVPVMVEAWRRSMPNAAAFTLVGTLAAYAVSVHLFSPTYFTSALPLVVKEYGHFFQQSPLAFVLPPFLLAALLPFNRASRPLLIAALAFYLAYVAQAKGWGYHAIPALGFLVLAIVTGVRSRESWQMAVSLAAVILAVLPGFRLYRAQPFSLQAPRGSTVAVLSTTTRKAWPTVEQRGYVWPLRSMSLWMNTPDWLEHDLACTPPDLILTDGPTAPILGRYQEIGVDGSFKLLRRTSTPAKPKDCRVIL